MNIRELLRVVYELCRGKTLKAISKLVIVQGLAKDLTILASVIANRAKLDVVCLCLRIQVRIQAI